MFCCSGWFIRRARLLSETWSNRYVLPLSLIGCEAVSYRCASYGISQHMTTLSMRVPDTGLLDAASAVGETSWGNPFLGVCPFGCFWLVLTSRNVST